MNAVSRTIIFLGGIALSLILLSGCGTPSQSVYVPIDTPTSGTGPDPTDIRTVVESMTRDLLQIPQFQAGERLQQLSCSQLRIAHGFGSMLKYLPLRFRI